MGARAGERAVVIGAGMAGLMAARVLADAYPEVTLVDRDDLPDRPESRRGVPQGRQPHALLAGGQLAMEELFPGLTAQLVAGGAPTGDALADARLTFGGHRLKQGSTGCVLLAVSRPYLEQEVRSRVRACLNVRFAAPGDVVGLTGSHGCGRVTGVRVLPRADGSAEEQMDADLVVDAGGRGSRLPVWLEALGYGRPPVEKVAVDLRYATRTYRLAPGALAGDLGSVHAPSPSRRRGAVLARVEGDRRWTLTLIGVLGDHPPRDPDDFLAFLRSLGPTDIAEALSSGEPLDDPVTFRFPAAVRHRYERMGRFPAGLAVLGDSVCSLNPIYGQGMTVAAQEALALRRRLAQGALPRPRRVSRDVARVLAAPWEMSVAADLAFDGVAGRRTTTVRLLGAYVSRLHAAAVHDEALGRAFVRVSGLVDPPGALLRPAVVLHALRPRGSGRGRWPAGTGRMLVAALLTPCVAAAGAATVAAVVAQAVRRRRLATAVRPGGPAGPT